jgi:flavin-dependent thymidylate synthase
MMVSKLKVNLGGIPVPMEFINGTTNTCTPEVISASYARLSRDPRPINELREEAIESVDKAKASNDNIIYGVGHASIAEHVNCNIDIYGISRYLVESVQKFRFASFTEKSQRYQPMQDDDFMMPKEIEENPKAKEIFENLLDYQIKTYNFLLDNLEENLLAQNKPKFDELKAKGEPITEFKKTVKGWAKEDARYALPLATTAQMGMTANARTIENMIPWFRASNLKENQEFAEKLYGAVKEYDSLIKYHEPTEFLKNKQNVREYFNENFSNIAKKGNSPLIVKVEEGADDKIMSKLLLDIAGMNVPYEYLKNMSNDKKTELYKKVLEKMNKHDAVPKAFEFATFTASYDVSASNFAQLKRHRPMNLLDGEYDISKTKEVPPRIKEFGFEQQLIDVYDKTDEAYEKLIPLVGKDVATYVLTNGHKKHVELLACIKEAYHISRLREDAHAQWSIRRDMNIIMEYIRQQAPLSAMLLCGKHEFDNKYKSVYENINNLF